MVELTAEEAKWLKRFKLCMKNAPESLGDKVSAFTIGDYWIQLYDSHKLKCYLRDNPLQNEDINTELSGIVENAKASLSKINFPFCIDSSSG